MKNYLNKYSYKINNNKKNGYKEQFLKQNL